MPRSHSIDMKLYKKMANNHSGFSVASICPLETGFKVWPN